MQTSVFNVVTLLLLMYYGVQGSVELYQVHNTNGNFLFFINKIIGCIVNVLRACADHTRHPTTHNKHVCIISTAVTRSQSFPPHDPTYTPVHSDTQMTFLESYPAIDAQFHTPRHSFFNISGYLVWSQPGRACDAMKETSDKSGGMNVAGNIVFIESGMG